MTVETRFRCDQQGMYEPCDVTAPAPPTQYDDQPDLPPGWVKVTFKLPVRGSSDAGSYSISLRTFHYCSEDCRGAHETRLLTIIGHAIDEIEKHTLPKNGGAHA